MTEPIDRVASLSPAQRAELLKRLADRRAGERASTRKREATSGPVPLLPAWRIPQSSGGDPHQNCTAALFRVHRRLEPGPSVAAVRQLVLHHDALRLRLREVDGCHEQFVAPPDREVPFTWIDQSALPTDYQEAAAVTEATADLQARLNLCHGPVMAITIIDLGMTRR